MYHKICIAAFFCICYLSGICLFAQPLSPTLAPTYAFSDSNGCLPPELSSYLDQQWAGKRFFLAGELHAMQASAPLQLQLMKFLHQQYGVRYLVVEHPVSRSYFLNRYLQAGQEADLDIAFPPIPHPYATHQREVFRQLRAYQSQLPEEAAIQVIGIDLEIHGLERPLLLMRELLARLQAFPELQATGETYLLAAAEDPYSRQSKKAFFQLWKTQIRGEQAIQESLSKEAYLWKNLLWGMKIHYEVPPMMLARRDHYLYQMFLHWYQDLPYPESARFFGQFGVAHVLLDGQPIPSLAHRLNEDTDSPVQGKVGTLRYEYPGRKYDMYGEKLTDDLVSELGIDAAKAQELAQGSHYVLLSLAEYGLAEKLQSRYDFAWLINPAE